MHRLILLFAVTLPAFSAVYYVDSTGGSDVQNGLSVATAWSTLAKATQAPLAPGDYVLLKRGGVWREPLVLNASGSPDLPINIGAYGAGANPTIDGSTLAARPVDLLSFAGKTDVVIDSLQL